MTPVANELPHVMESPSPSPAHAANSLLTGAIAAVITLAMAGIVFAVGVQLVTYDEQRSHIPGHWLYRALVVMPAVVQLAYVLPAWRAARKRHNVAVARGVAVGAVMALVVNVAIVGLVAWMTAPMAKFD